MTNLWLSVFVAAFAACFFGALVMLAIIACAGAIVTRRIIDPDEEIIDYENAMRHAEGELDHH